MSPLVDTHDRCRQNRLSVVRSIWYALAAKASAGTGRALVYDVSRGAEFAEPHIPMIDMRTPEEAVLIMIEVFPILLVVIFWVLVGVFSVVLFRRWLHVPTEAELELAREHAHGTHVTEAEKNKVEQTVKH